MTSITVQQGTTLYLTSDNAASISSIVGEMNANIILLGAALDLTYLSVMDGVRIAGYGSIRITQEIYFSNNCIIDLSHISLTLVDSDLTVGAKNELFLQDFPIQGEGNSNVKFLSTPVFDSSTALEKDTFGFTTKLFAPCKQIFKGVTVTGKVQTTTACPEWFVDTSDMRTDVQDWAPYINLAFDLSANGEVRLQSKRYLIGSTIFVPTRGRLTGTASGIWSYYSDSSYKEVGGTVLTVNNQANFTAGCMVLVNYSKQYIEDKTQSSQTISFGELKNPSSTSAYQNTWVYPGGKISNIRFINHYSSNHCCILVAGCMAFDNLCIQLFRNGIVWSNQYADQKEVTRCIFMHDRQQDTTDYLLDFNNVGDGLVCSGNAFNSESSTKAQFINILQCFGGSITDNIINGDVRIVGCKALDFTGNHLENGAQVMITSSCVNLNNNYFEKGLRPNIVIKSDINYDASIVNLNNNSFIYFSNKRNLLNNGEWQLPTSEHNSEYSLEDICEYDIVFRGIKKDGVEHGPISTINVTNTLRYWITLTQSSHVYPVGIKLGIDFQNDDNSIGEIREVENFNDYSHLYSTQSTLHISNKITISSPSVTINELSSASMSLWGLTTNTSWFKKENATGASLGSYKYYYQFIWDKNKKLVTPSGAAALKPMTTNTGSSLVSPTENSGVLFNIATNSGFGCTGLVRVIRERIEASTVKEVVYADIPLVTCRHLYDNGVTIGSYLWKTTDSLTAATIKGSTPDTLTFP